MILAKREWVRNESYETVAEMNRRLKREWLDEAEDDEDRRCVENYWPFQDHEELDQSTLPHQRLVLLGTNRTA